MFNITLMIRKTHFHTGKKHPTLTLMSKVRMHAPTHESPTVMLDVVKGVGFDAEISKNEDAFVKFLVKNYGEGKYTIVRAGGPFKSFWNGYIEVDRYIREKGKVVPYLQSQTPRQWHAIYLPQPVSPS